MATALVIWATGRSGLTASVGEIIVPMVLTNGSPLPGRGTSFNVSFTLSSITAIYSPGTYTWDTTAGGITTLPYYGMNYPNGLYDNIPGQNLGFKNRTINGVFFDGENGSDWVNEMVNSNFLVYSGAFSITSGALPTTPTNYAITAQNTAYGAGWFLTYDDFFVTGGMYGEADNYDLSFGQTVNYRFMSLFGDEAPPPNPDYPIWAGLSSVTYEAIPEPTSVGLLLGSGLLALMARKRWRRRLAS